MESDGWRSARPDGDDGSNGTKTLPLSRSAPALPVLEALNPRHQPKQKHKVYYELVEVDATKKKLEFEETSDFTPPPGYEFVAIGNPELTRLCKDLSRENNLKIYMVSQTDRKTQVAMQMTRSGHHFLASIVEEAQMELGYYPTPGDAAHGIAEPIPEKQKDINEQADAAIRDLFPRIPNTDRQMIIDHAFQKGRKFNGDKVVGLCSELPLSRRVQLAVLAHIRHNHTRYDELLRQTTYVMARRTVEAACIDFLVKWRGDEENGRDDLDTILREVVVISDSEDDDGDETDNEESETSSMSVEEADVQVVSDAAASVDGSVLPSTVAAASPQTPGRPGKGPKRGSGPKKQRANERPKKPKGVSKQAFKRQQRAERKAAKLQKRAQRGFQRYQTAWNQAVDRQRQRDKEAAAPVGSSAMGRSISHGSYATLDLDAVPGRAGYARPAPQHAQMSLPPRAEALVRRPAWTEGYSTMPEDSQALESRSFVFGANQTTVLERRPVPLAYDTHRPASVGPISPMRNRYQDLLVPSIEAKPPRSGSQQPQFIRTLPPRKHARERSPEYRQGTQHNLSPRSPASAAFHESPMKRRRVNMNEHVVRDVADYPVPPVSRQPQLQPSQGLSMASHPYSRGPLGTVEYRPGPPPGVVDMGNGKYHRLIVREREPAFVEVDAPLRTRGNPIYVDDVERHTAPVITRRMPEREWDIARRPDDGVELLEVRRPAPAPSGLYHGAAHRIVSQEFPPSREMAFPVQQRPPDTRPLPTHYHSDSESQRWAQASSEAIYIRTVEPPRDPVRDYVEPITQRPSSTTGQDLHPRHAGTPDWHHAGEVYHGDGRSLQPSPLPYAPQEPIYVAPRQQPPPLPQLSPYREQQFSPRRNL